MIKIVFDHRFDDYGNIIEIHEHIALGAVADELLLAQVYRKTIGMAVRLTAFPIVVAEFMTRFKMERFF